MEDVNKSYIVREKNEKATNKKAPKAVKKPKSGAKKTSPKKTSPKWQQILPKKKPARKKG
jgi:hypothetical protein